MPPKHPTNNDVTPADYRSAARVLLADKFSEACGSYVAESAWCNTEADRLESAALVERLAHIAWTASQDAAYNRSHDTDENPPILIAWQDRTDDDREFTRAGIRAMLDDLESSGRLVPAAPAQEETKAEAVCEVNGRTCFGCKACALTEEEATLAARAEGWYEGYEVGLKYGPLAASGEEYDGPINPYDVPASSPVVPAPTETGPWQHRVNGEICVASPASGLPYTIGKFNDHGDFVWHSSAAELPEGFAPFIAAEGDA